MLTQSDFLLSGFCSLLSPKYFAQRSEKPEGFPNFVQPRTVWFQPRLLTEPSFWTTSSEDIGSHGPGCPCLQGCSGCWEPPRQPALGNGPMRGHAGPLRQEQWWHWHGWLPNEGAGAGDGGHFSGEIPLLKGPFPSPLERGHRSSLSTASQTLSDLLFI